MFPVATPLLIEYVKKRIGEKKPLKEIEDELKAAGYTEAETLEAIDEATPEPEKTFTISPFLSIILIFLAMGFLLLVPSLLGKPFNVTFIFIVFVSLIAKAFLYAFVFNILLLMTEYREWASWSKCFNVGMLIGLISLIQVPYIKYLILAFALFFTIIFFKTATFKTYFLFLVFVIFVEIFSGLALTMTENVLAGRDMDDMSLTAQKYCTLHKDPDIFSRGYLQANSGRRYDYCLNSTLDSTDECIEDCYVMEYSCFLFNIKEEEMPCPGPCRAGACVQ